MSKGEEGSSQQLEIMIVMAEASAPRTVPRPLPGAKAQRAKVRGLKAEDRLWGVALGCQRPPNPPLPVSGPGW